MSEIQVRETQVRDGAQPGQRSSGRRPGARQPIRDSSGSRLLGPAATALLATLIIALNIGGAYLAARVGPVVHGAQIEVVHDLGGSGGEAEAQAATRDVVARSRAVLDPVAVKHGITVDELEEIADIEPVATSNVTRFTVAHPDPEQARVLAQSLAEQYVEGLKPPATSADAPAVGVIRAQIDELTNQQVEIDGQLAQIAAARESARQSSRTPPYPPEEPRLAARSEQLQRQIGALYDHLADVQLQPLILGQARILTPAYVLDEPLAPKPARAAAVGGLVGLVLASGMVVAITQRRPRA